MDAPFPCASLSAWHTAHAKYILVKPRFRLLSLRTSWLPALRSSSLPPVLLVLWVLDSSTCLFRRPLFRRWLESDPERWNSVGLGSATLWPSGSGPLAPCGWGSFLGPAPTLAWEGGGLTYGHGPEGLGAVPHAVEGPALISHVVFHGPHGQQAVDDHLVEGLLAQDL